LRRTSSEADEDEILFGAARLCFEAGGLGGAGEYAWSGFRGIGTAGDVETYRGNAPEIGLISEFGEVAGGVHLAEGRARKFIDGEGG
jgi:hypothetical protein